MFRTEVCVKKGMDVGRDESMRSWTGLGCAGCKCKRGDESEGRAWDGRAQEGPLASLGRFPSGLAYPTRARVSLPEASILCRFPSDVRPYLPHQPDSGPGKEKEKLPVGHTGLVLPATSEMGWPNPSWFCPRWMMIVLQTRGGIRGGFDPAVSPTVFRARGLRLFGTTDDNIQLD